MKINTIKGVTLTKLLFCIILCVFSISTINAETVQQVIVKEYIPDVKHPTLNANKVPLANVEVIVKGAGSTITDANGSCLLKFNLLKGGDRIVVRQFARPGYELLNPELLNDLVIRRDNKPLEVVMISQENAIKLSRIISKQVGDQFDKMRLRELNELDILAVDYENKRKAIIEKYEAKLDDVDHYIDRLVRVDITRVTENESAAFEAFNNGDLEKALKLFDDEQLIEKYRQTVESISAVKEAHAKVDEAKDEQLQNQKDIQYFLKTQITMLEMAGTEKSLRKAKQLLEQLLEIEPFGEFQDKEYMAIVIALKDYDFVNTFLRNHLNDPTISPFTRARLAVNLGVVLYEQKKYDEVLELLLPFENVMDETCERHPDDPLALYLPVLAQEMLGHCESLAGARDNAVMHYRKMYDLYLKLREVDAMTKFYANVTYPRLIRGIRQLTEMEEWGLADTIYQSAYPRVEFYYANGSLRERFLWARFRMGGAIMLIKQNQLDDGMRIVFKLLPDVDEIYKENHPLCSELYQSMLLRTTNYYYESQRYPDVVKSAKRWFEVSELPYNKDFELANQNNLDEEEVTDYRNVCFMYQVALDQTPQNP